MWSPAPICVEERVQFANVERPARLKQLAFQIGLKECRGGRVRKPEYLRRRSGVGEDDLAAAVLDDEDLPTPREGNLGDK